MKLIFDRDAVILQVPEGTKPHDMDRLKAKLAESFPSRNPVVFAGEIEYREDVELVEKLLATCEGSQDCLVTEEGEKIGPFFRPTPGRVDYTELYNIWQKLVLKGLLSSPDIGRLVPKEGSGVMVIQTPAGNVITKDSSLQGMDAVHALIQETK